MREYLLDSSLRHEPNDLRSITLRTKIYTACPHNALPLTNQHYQYSTMHTAQCEPVNHHFHVQTIAKIPYIAALRVLQRYSLPSQYVREHSLRQVCAREPRHPHCIDTTRRYLLPLHPLPEALRYADL